MAESILKTDGIFYRVSEDRSIAWYAKPGGLDRARGDLSMIEMENVKDVYDLEQDQWVGRGTKGDYILTFFEKRFSDDVPFPVIRLSPVSPDIKKPTVMIVYRRKR